MKMRMIDDTVIVNDLVDMFKVNRYCNWSESDPQVEFQELIDYVKRQRAMAKYIEERKKVKKTS